MTKHECSDCGHPTDINELNRLGGVCGHCAHHQDQVLGPRDEPINHHLAHLDRLDTQHGPHQA